MRRYASIAETFFGLAFLILTSSVFAASLDDTLSRAKAQLQAGHNAAALQTLQAQADQYAGTPRFDYLYGVAARRTGHPAEASFALERVVLVQPDNADARLELAAAYLDLSRRNAALREMQPLAGVSLTPEQSARRKELEKQAGAGAAGGQESGFGGYLTLEAGHDSNVSTSTDQDYIYQPFGPPPSIVPQSTMSSPYSAVRGGLQYAGRVTENQKATVFTSGWYRNNERDTADTYDEQGWQGGAQWGWSFTPGQTWDVRASYGGLRLDYKKYYRQGDVSTGWTLLPTNNQPGLRVRFGWHNVRYHDSHSQQLSQYDYERWHLLTGTDFRFSEKWRLHLNLLLAMENATGNRPGDDARDVGFSEILEWRPLPRHRFDLAVGASRRSYQDDYPTYLQGPAPILGPQAIGPKQRIDTRFDATLGWRWLFMKNWELRARVQHRTQDSSVTIYSYDRTIGSLAVSRYF